MGVSCNDSMGSLCLSLHTGARWHTYTGIRRATLTFRYTHTHTQINSWSHAKPFILVLQWAMWSTNTESWSHTQRENDTEFNAVSTTTCLQKYITRIFKNLSHNVDISPPPQQIEASDIFSPFLLFHKEGSSLLREIFLLLQIRLWLTEQWGRTVRYRALPQNVFWNRIYGATSQYLPSLPCF